MGQKIIWMQLLLIGLISSSFILACNKVDNETTSDYIYVNPTSHNIIIQSFYSGADTFYSLNKYETLKLTEDLMSGASFILVRADSAKIIFDSLKFELVKKTANNKGILNIEDYSYKKIINNHHEFTFTFNEEMYNNAQFLK